MLQRYCNLKVNKSQARNFINFESSIMKRILKLVQGKLSPREFLIFSSILVGLTAGMAAVILKTFVHYIQVLITYDFQVSFKNYLYLIFPLIGLILTTWIIKRIFQGKLNRGTSNIIRSIVKKSGFLPKDQMYSHVVTSSVTVGFGGSAGLESPIVSTGTAIGSNYARTYHLIYKDRILLLACGASAGIAAAFNAPIAGVLFSLEVLMVDASISAFIPLIISAASGALLANIILGKSILLNFQLLEPFDYHNVPFYALLGILCGMISVYYSRMYMRLEHRLSKTKLTAYPKALRGGMLLMMLILVFPSLFGEGYESIKLLASDKPFEIYHRSILEPLLYHKGLILIFIALVIFFKVIAAVLTIGSGGNGGNFAPSLFVGAYLGYVFSKAVELTGFIKLPVTNFTLVGMAGILTGVFHAPLTGIFLIAEITGGYELMIPLMLVSALSYTVVRYFEPMSMDAKILAKKGEVVTTNRDATLLSGISMEQVIEREFVSLHPNMTMEEAMQILKKSNKNYFPVVTEINQLVGVLLLDNIREMMFEPETHKNILVSDMMSSPPFIVSDRTPVFEIMKKMDESNAWILPVHQNGDFIGFIHKNKLLNSYREQLLKVSARE